MLHKWVQKWLKVMLLHKMLDNSIFSVFLTSFLSNSEKVTFLKGVAGLCADTVVGFLYQTQLHFQGGREGGLSKYEYF